MATRVGRRIDGGGRFRGTDRYQDGRRHSSKACAGSKLNYTRTHIVKRFGATQLIDGER